MFTGLVEEIGEISGINLGSLSLKIKIQCKKVIKDAKIGDSIATNGVCLTATNIGTNFFEADVMYESIKRSNLKRLKYKEKVNLEKSITLSTPLGGHLVTGDIDGEGIISNIYNEGIAKIYEIKASFKLMKYIVEKGRVTLDGASLTVVDFNNDTFRVSLIPHTQEMIVLGNKVIGNYINIETDLIGKYVEKLMNFETCENKESNLTKKFLSEKGFL